jgi:hypothetical protein
MMVLRNKIVDQKIEMYEKNEKLDIHTIHCAEGFELNTLAIEDF